MTELVERYVHQVGRYLPPGERAEIEAELRSQIQDKLDDRYGGAPTQEETAAVLAEYGHPYLIAASYSSEKYLVGPMLYPYMMLVLRYVWLLVPAVMIFLGIFGALISPQPVNPLSAALETLIAAVQATLSFSAIVVLFFALMQHSYLKIGGDEQAFNPSDLPEVDHPGTVDRFEIVAGVAFGVVLIPIFLYWLAVGGLTLRFNLSDPGEVIPVPAIWMILLLLTGASEILLNLVALRRNRWSARLWLAEMLLEVFGIICLYFVVFEPIFNRIAAANPALVDLPVIGSAPEIITVGFALIALFSKGSRLVRLWTYQTGSTASFAAQTAD